MPQPFSHTSQDATAVIGGGEAISVLLVGSHGQTQEIEQLLCRVDIRVSVQCVDSYLMALGRVAKEPPSVVMGYPEDFKGGLEPTAEALRQLAPEALLVLVVEAGSKTDVQPTASGFDHSLMEPIDPDALYEVLSQVNLRGTLSKESAWLMDHSPSYQEMIEQVEGTVEQDDYDEHHTHPVEKDTTCGEGQRTVEDAGAVVAALGDETSLIEQVILGRRAVREVGLRLIASRSGMTHLGWSDRADQVPRGHVHVDVVYGDHEPLGVLHAQPPAGADQLAPWASWLAGWLELDRHMGRLRHQAMRDELTGLWNRRYFNQFLNALLSRAANRRLYVSLLVFDVDDFKSYNDRYGHGAGDEILRETAKLMQTLVREHDVVARIGGDEFAVIFWDPSGPRRPNSAHPLDPIKVAQRFRAAICAHRFPKLGDEAPGTLTISGGLAGFPWDGHTPEDLLNRADQMAMRSKQQGKNAITLGSGARLHCHNLSQ